MTNTNKPQTIEELRGRVSNIKQFPHKLGQDSIELRHYYAITRLCRDILTALEASHERVGVLEDALEHASHAIPPSITLQIVEQALEQKGG